MTLQDSTILVVDDEPELLEIFSIWLRRSGANVLTAPNGAEALKLLDEHPVQAMVSDIRMPIMDGVTLVHRLHELEFSIPSIIFVSGFGEVDSRTLYGLGVEAMLPKPLGRNQLMQVLESSLRPREELWQTPLTVPAQKQIVAQLPTLDDMDAPGTFSLGRGGCCFSYPHSLPECTVDLHLTFADSPNELIGQGCARWYDAKTRTLGVEFLYLDPRSRPWVLACMHQQEQNGTMRSFIPAAPESAATTVASYITNGASMPR